MPRCPDHPDSPDDQEHGPVAQHVPVQISELFQKQHRTDHDEGERERDAVLSGCGHSDSSRVKTVVNGMRSILMRMKVPPTKILTGRPRPPTAYNRSFPR